VRLRLEAWRTDGSKTDMGGGGGGDGGGGGGGGGCCVVIEVEELSMIRWRSCGGHQVPLWYVELCHDRGQLRARDGEKWGREEGDDGFRVCT
jgi:hypothetical protein